MRLNFVITCLMMEMKRGSWASSCRWFPGTRRSGGAGAYRRPVRFLGLGQRGPGMTGLAQLAVGAQAGADRTGSAALRLGRLLQSTILVRGGSHEEGDEPRPHAVPTKIPGLRS